MRGSERSWCRPPPTVKRCWRWEVPRWRWKDLAADSACRCEVLEACRASRCPAGAGTDWEDTGWAGWRPAAVAAGTCRGGGSVADASLEPSPGACRVGPAPCVACCSLAAFAGLGQRPGRRCAVVEGTVGCSAQGALAGWVAWAALAGAQSRWMQRHLVVHRTPDRTCCRVEFGRHRNCSS